MQDDERTVLTAQVEFLASEVKNLTARLSLYHGNLVLLQKQIEDLKKEAAVDVTDQIEAADEGS